MAKNEKSPRLIRRGDVVKLRDADQYEVVRDVQVVLRLANGHSETYGIDERVTTGTDNDVDDAVIIDAVIADATARKERAEAALEATKAAIAVEEEARAAEAALAAARGGAAPD